MISEKKKLMIALVMRDLIVLEVQQAQKVLEIYLEMFLGTFLVEVEVEEGAKYFEEQILVMSYS